MFVDLPDRLRGADFVRVRFSLEFQESWPCPPDAILRLRRDLHQAGRMALGGGERFASLFDPPLPSDPAAVRRFQRPGPCFVLHPPDALQAVFGPGDVLPLTVVFLGTGIQRLSDFTLVLQELGRCGLHRGEGRFEVAEIVGTDPAGALRPIWRPGQSLGTMAPPVLSTRWWLETALPADSPVGLEFLTPARLLVQGRPLFRATFSRLFPFFLRRVTSMLFTHCGIEAVDDPKELLGLTPEVAETDNRLGWNDWRVLEGEGERIDFGGVGGSIRLEGEALGSLLWVLGLGSLLNIGRGASYAAGRVILRPLQGASPP